MAGGWSKDGAVQEQIDASVDDAIKQLRSQIPNGVSLTHCDNCGSKIPQARQIAIPGVSICITCQAEFEQKQTKLSSYNRRGSKDSQLR